MNSNTHTQSSSDYAPPSHPPPPQVPQGWTVRWDDRYHRFYYVNLKTKQPQWEAPEGTTFSDEPPAYQQSATPPRTPEPVRQSHNASPAPMASSSRPQMSQQSESHKGFASKVGDFLEKRARKKAQYYNSRPMIIAGGRPAYGGYGYPGYGGGMMGGPMMGGGYGRRPGMGMGGAAALGAGGGLLGGMMLANAMDDNDYGEGYAEGYEDAYDGGGFDGGDFGGGDFGGGDF